MLKEATNDAIGYPIFLGIIQKKTWFYMKFHFFVALKQSKTQEYEFGNKTKSEGQRSKNGVCKVHRQSILMAFYQVLQTSSVFGSSVGHHYLTITYTI